MSGIDNTYVLLGQMAQMLKTLGDKGWGRRELTLMGQATPMQIEEVRALLQGRGHLVPVAKRWWHDGQEIVLSYSNDDRSGAELFRQDPDHFGGERASRLATRLLPKIERIKGEGELVIVPCPFFGATYEETLKQLLESRPDLERAPQAAVLQLSSEVVSEIDVPIVVGSDPIQDDPCPVVFRWALNLNTNIATLETLDVRDCGYAKAVWWKTKEFGFHFLLKRKAG